MKAAIALLSDYRVQNIARRMVYQISQLGEVRFLGSLLPAHVSLKQPFTFESMDALETWFDSFSARVKPFHVELDRVYYEACEQYAIVGLNVRQTPTLRALHDQVTLELKDVVHDPSAAHDGAEYRFHLTVELGETDSTNPFKQFYESLPQQHLDLSFTAEYIALFFYPYEPIEPSTFICYKVVPLTG